MKRMIGTCCAIALGVTLGSPPLVDRAGAQNARVAQGEKSASTKQEEERRDKQATGWDADRFDWEEDGLFR